MHYYFTFDSIHFVLKAEKLILQNGINLDIVPTPRDLSSNCGMCIKVLTIDKDRVLELLTANKITTYHHQRK